MEGVGGTPHGRNFGKVNPLKSSLEESPPTSSSLKEGGTVCGEKWEGGQCRDKDGLFTNIQHVRGSDKTDQYFRLPLKQSLETLSMGDNSHFDIPASLEHCYFPKLL